MKMKKIFLLSALLVLIALLLTSCDFSTSSALQWWQDYQNNLKNSTDSDAGLTGPVALKLTYPAGRSPNVFTTGWEFGASCVANGQDVSDTVKWTGSGDFSPAVGSLSRPSFTSTGSNSITLTATVAGKDYTKTYTVNAVSPAGYACVGMKAFCPADSHGAPGDPVPVVGPITSGSGHVLVDGRPAARVGDVGFHLACSGPNTFTIVSGDPSVLIDGRAAAKVGSTTQHCGGMGHIIEGAPQ
jgi:uncharacterized Zn-binding protein involved in type VI secretion